MSLQHSHYTALKYTEISHVITSTTIFSNISTERDKIILNGFPKSNLYFILLFNIQSNLFRSYTFTGNCLKWFKNTFCYGESVVINKHTFLQCPVRYTKQKGNNKHNFWNYYEKIYYFHSNDSASICSNISFCFSTEIRFPLSSQLVEKGFV